MGIMYNSTVAETELYTAYGYTVSGKINDYMWTYDGSGRREKCYISIKITDAEENIIYNRHMGNNVILEGTFNRHIDNLLWWIAEDNPSAYELEKTINKVLVQNDSLFSVHIRSRKTRQRARQSGNIILF